LTVLLVASGAVESLAKMRRADWFPFNVASIVLLVLAAGILLWTAKVSRNSREPIPESSHGKPALHGNGEHGTAAEAEAARVGN